GSQEQALRGFRDDRYRSLLATEAQVIPGVADTLAQFHGRLPMAIVTSCRRVNFLEMHARSGLLGFFDFILTREDYGNSKPDPEPYLTACARVGLPPSACLAVEDSERGVLAAARAGLSVAAVPGLLNQGGDFATARWRLDSIDQLPGLLSLS
ncbi:MAG TPA: HAD family hydrolase, partial [Geobacteraceae bacterium]